MCVEPLRSRNLLNGANTKKNPGSDSFNGSARIGHERRTLESPGALVGLVVNLDAKLALEGTDLLLELGVLTADRRKMGKDNKINVGWLARSKERTPDCGQPYPRRTNTKLTRQGRQPWLVWEGSGERVWSKQTAGSGSHEQETNKPKQTNRKRKLKLTPLD